MTLQNRVTLEEAQSGLARLIDQVRQGEDVVLVENGVEVARLVAPATMAEEERKPKRQGGFLKGEIIEHDPDWWKPENDLTDLFEVYGDSPEDPLNR